MANTPPEPVKPKSLLGVFGGTLVGVAIGFVGIDLARGAAVDVVRLLVVLGGAAVGAGLVVLLRKK
ncbi:hypothetical protein SH528x_003553 [Novipirellula sp. SH528]|uniref:hypothetical protein n=1 Tax=Novipirellula sp. SH528 TaxID=3454466 RepID=UPI003FA08109